MYEERFTPNEITELMDNEVFVFGSNVQGEHIGGAAKCAIEKFGAVMGQGIGLQGNSYAIPTCDRSSGYTKPIADLNDIRTFVNEFIKHATYFNGNVYYVTKIGCGIGGFKVEDIAPMFKECLGLDNVYLPQEFFECLLKEK